MLTLGSPSMVGCTRCNVTTPDFGPERPSARDPDGVRDLGGLAAAQVHGARVRLDRRDLHLEPRARAGCQAEGPATHLRVALLVADLQGVRVAGPHPPHEVPGSLEGLVAVETAGGAGREGADLRDEGTD